MEYRYKLSEDLSYKASHFSEFRNGAAQATIILKNGRQYPKALISNSIALIALRGHKDLPFNIHEISDILQTKEDKNPKETDNWEFWDKW